MPRRERPLGPGEDVVVRFAADLRRLRDGAGGPTYRDMSTRAGYSAAALSEAAGGRKLPGLALTTAYVATCGGDVSAWEGRWRAVAAELAAAEGTKDAVEAEIPYLGLAAFQPGDAGRFFGREKLLSELTGKLARRRFVGVFGASGSGKSSLLRAGLAASEPGRTVVCTPGEHPLGQCAEGLAASGQLVIVDQFEEVFTLCHDDAERTRFWEMLLALATDEHGTRVVIGVRADFYGHCGRHAGLVDALRDAQVMVGPMTPDELRTVIVEPAVRLGCRVEAALVTTLVADTVGQPAVLPLVSHALLETWRRRQGITLTSAAYEAAGGIQNAIAHTAESAYAELDPDRQARVRQVFLRLTALGEGTEDTKRRLHRRELDDDLATKDVLERLADARLLALDRDGVDIAHEALIRSWPRLQDWLAEDREGHRLHRQLAEATDLWESLDRDAGSLYRGTRLGLAAEWATRSPGALTTREQAFLDAGLAAEAAEAAAVRRRTRRLRQLVALLGVLLLLAGVATVYAVRAEQQATDQRDIALARKAVGDAADLRDTNPALSVQLSLAAYRLASIPESRNSLLGAMATPFATRLNHAEDGLGHDDPVAISGTGRLMVTAGNTRIVQVWDIGDPRRPALLATLPEAAQVHYPVALSWDGATLATTTSGNEVRLWDLHDPRRPMPRGLVSGHTDTVFDAQITRDGRTLVTAGKDGTTRLEDISDLDHPKNLAVRPGSKVSLSQDGGLMAVSDKETVLWDIHEPASPVLLSTIGGHTDLPNLAAFGPDGHTLATTGWDARVLLWDITDLHSPRRLAAVKAGGIVWMAAFSPDGRVLAAVGDDAQVRLWDVSVLSAPRALTQLAGHTNASVWVGFTPDGRTLVSAAGDETVRLQDMPALDLSTRASGAIGFTPDGRTLVTPESGTGDLLLWTVADARNPRRAGRIHGLPGQVTATALSSDGRTLVLALLNGPSVAAATGGLLQRWDITDPAQPRFVASAAVPQTYSIAFSQDGRRLATGYDDGPAALWDIGDPQRFTPLATLPLPRVGTVWSLRFTPDGRTLINSQNMAVTLWDVSDPLRPSRRAVLTTTTGAFLSLALGPDGRTLAGANTDRTAYLWDIGDPGHPVPLPGLTGHTDGIATVSFSPSGTEIVTGSPDRTVRLWDVRDRQHPVMAALLGMRVSSWALFSPDGHTVFVGSDGTYLWETDADRAARDICAAATPRITPAEWETYFPGLAYDPPCKDS